MRPARALINLQALRHNYRVARQLCADKALAVVKADAYGHGAVHCALALHDIADGFAVACLDEALELREAGVTLPILLLEGFFDPDELQLIVAHDLWCVIHADWQLEALERAALLRPLTVWLKMDSGMHRVGFFPREYQAAWQRLQVCSNVATVVLMSHFSQADELHSARTQEQYQIFTDVVTGMQAPISLCNSPALLAWPSIRSDWSRPGIILYGSQPVAMHGVSVEKLQPVMTLQSKIISVRELSAGEPVGYGAQYVSEQPVRVGIVAMGYADGYPRHAPTGTPVAVDGRMTQILGRVSMDMLAVDLTGLKQAGVGSSVELWGAIVSVDEVATRAGTISYELLCNVKRVRYEYSAYDSLKNTIA
ncbi:alanine racemase [Pseudomonas sp. C27(2019)]|uniref:alanine racemase n=1 Tax=Pseudomonas sp. C27(2019) TaxID=2604941 RepID=UPI0012454E93|nr:alanine racemase [Pseudomonas sp. C27(2019)]QEY57900.1 alanine racemase [Pseudomonas sp. C27(2019)]